MLHFNLDSAKFNFSEVVVADNNVDAPDWTKIPAPHNDGGAQHLYGLRLPSIPLPATSGVSIDLAVLPGRTVVYAYPCTFLMRFRECTPRVARSEA